MLRPLFRAGLGGGWARPPAHADDLPARLDAAPSSTWPSTRVASGPFNLCCPETPTNAEFTEALAAPAAPAGAAAGPGPLLQRRAGPGVARSCCGRSTCGRRCCSTSGYAFRDPDVSAVLRAGGRAARRLSTSQRRRLAAARRCGSSARRGAAAAARSCPTARPPTSRSVTMQRPGRGGAAQLAHREQLGAAARGPPAHAPPRRGASPGRAGRPPSPACRAPPAAAGRRAPRRRRAARPRPRSTSTGGGPAGALAAAISTGSISGGPCAGCVAPRSWSPRQPRVPAAASSET